MEKHEDRIADTTKGPVYIIELMSNVNDSLGKIDINIINNISGVNFQLFWSEVMSKIFH